MAIIIGAGTTYSFDYQGNGCVVSANWGYSPNNQRVYCLGSWSAAYNFARPTENLSFTMYSPSAFYAITPSTECENVTDINASVAPAACGAGSTELAVDGFWALTGYNYSKDDPNLPGQETWNMTRWVACDTCSPTVPAPNYVLRGVSDGQGTADGAIGSVGGNDDLILISGVILNAADSTSSRSGSVSGGQVGRGDVIYTGTAKQVGAGSAATGIIGNGSANIPLTPLWI